MAENEVTPMNRKKKSGAPLERDEAQKLVRELVQGCVNFAEETLSPEREKATSYYKGEPFGNEKPGRSQVVVTEVRDQVRGVLPSFMRVIFGPERVVEFRATSKDTEPQARNQTDCVQHVFTEDNNGFMETQAVVKDGLIRRLGTFKAWWVKDERVADSYSEMTDAAFAELAATEGVKITRALKKAEGGYGTVEYTTLKPGYEKVQALKPEQVLFNAMARDGASALFIGHQEEVTRGELLAMGYTKQFIDDYGQKSRTLADNAEALARVPQEAVDPEAGEANDKILYVEGYARVDLDDDGVQELRKLCMVGPGFEIANGDGFGEIVDHVPLYFFCPDPEPHTLNGHSLADLVMDLQLTESSLVRAMLDSLAMSIFPRTAFVEGQVNVKDVMNTEVGATIRERAPGMVHEFTHTFVGKEALGVLEFYRGLGERRTGQANGANDLDLDALQSTTKSGVDAAITGSQAQTELMVRNLAEQCLKPLFRGIARDLKKYDKGERQIKVRGKWITMKPSDWQLSDVRVTTALGAMLPEKKLEILANIKTTQEQYLTMLGPSNPLVNLHQLSNTLSRATELAGFPDSEEFFNSVPADWQPPQPEPGAEKPSPEELVAQVEREKLQAQVQKDQATLELKAQELALKEKELQQNAELEMHKMELDAQLKMRELELEYNTKIEAAKLDADVKRQVAADRLVFEREHAAARLELDTKRVEHEALVKEDKQQHDKKVDAHTAILAEDMHDHTKQMDERQAEVAGGE